MKIGTIVMSVGAGMLAGAAVTSMLRQQPGFDRTVRQAADSIENAVEDARDFITGC